MGRDSPRLQKGTELREGVRPYPSLVQNRVGGDSIGSQDQEVPSSPQNSGLSLSNSDEGCPDRGGGGPGTFVVGNPYSFRESRGVLLIAISRYSSLFSH